MLCRHAVACGLVARAGEAAKARGRHNFTLMRDGVMGTIEQMEAVCQCISKDFLSDQKCF